MRQCLSWLLAWKFPETPIAPRIVRTLRTLGGSPALRKLDWAPQKIGARWLPVIHRLRQMQRQQVSGVGQNEGSRASYARLRRDAVSRVNAVDHASVEWVNEKNAQLGRCYQDGTTEILRGMHAA